MTFCHNVSVGIVLATNSFPFFFLLAVLLWGNTRDTGTRAFTGKAQSTQDAGRGAQCDASKWDLLMWLGVSTLHASNIKGKMFQFARASRPASCVDWASKKKRPKVLFDSDCCKGTLNTFASFCVFLNSEWSESKIAGCPAAKIDDLNLNCQEASNNIYIRHKIMSRHNI